MGAAPHRPPSHWSAGDSPGQSLAEDRVSCIPVHPSSPSLATLGCVFNPQNPTPRARALCATILVFQEVREVVELWDELLHICRALQACLPGCCHGVELPVRAVEAGRGAWAKVR